MYTSLLGSPITTGIFEKRKEIHQEIEVSYNTNKTYYLLVEYLNDEENNQDNEQGKNFTINIGFTDKIEKLATDYIISLAEENKEELAYDETVDNNLRYIGANPNNYVKFNNELWQIIGVMNNASDSSGNKETRIKLIKEKSLTTMMAWDSDGKSNWETSSSKSYLNGYYYNSLTSEAKSMISNITWNLGGSSTSEATASTFYTAERGETTYNNYPTTGIGYVGLIYPSDFGYAVGGSVRNTCLSTSLGRYNYNNCYENDWLSKIENNRNQWTLCPQSSTNVHVVGWSISHTYVKNNMHENFYPVVYLNSNIKIKDGSGASSNPFILGI